MILIDDHADGLNDLAEQHYANLNLMNQPAEGEDQGEYWAWSLIGRIRTQKNISQLANEPQQVNFWDYLLNDDFAKLKRLIVGRPNVLKELIEEIDNLFGNALFSIDYSYNRAVLTEFGQSVSTAFAYETLYRSQNECVQNFQALNLEHCPYCNTNSLEMVICPPELEGIERSRVLHQVDHFYPQCRHPYLALSFFNLIPACYTCNAALKSKKKFDIDTHFNPFHRRLDDHFAFDVNTIIPTMIDDLEFSYVLKNDSTYSDQALNDFNIIARYHNPTNKRSVYYMLNELKNYSPEVIASSLQQINGLAASNHEAHRNKLRAIGIPPILSETNCHSLGKLKRDIYLKMAAVV